MNINFQPLLPRILRGIQTPGGLLGPAYYQGGLQDPETQGHLLANETENQRAAELGVDPFANRALVSGAAQDYIASGNSTGLQPPIDQPPVPGSQPPGTGGGGAVQLPSWIFEGNVFSNFLDYLNAANAAINRDLETGSRRAREEGDRSRTSLLDQVMRLLGDLDTSERKGQADLTSYYGGLGDIYQSSEGVRRGQLTEEVGKERTRINKEKEQGMAEIDRNINDYLSNLNQSATSQRDKLTSGAVQTRDQLALNPSATLRTGAPQVGAAQVTDTSALLSALNDYLTPANLRNRYRTTATGSQPINQYLNPVG